VEQGKQTGQSKIPRNVVTSVQWLPQGSSSVAQTSEDLTVRIWDSRQSLLQCSRTLRGYVYFPLCIDVHEEGNLLLTGSKGFNGNGGEATLWDLRMEKILWRGAAHSMDVVGCKFIQEPPDTGDRQTMMATVSKDRSLRVYDLASKDIRFETMETDGDPFTCLACPKSGSRDALLCTSTFSGELGVWDHSQKLVAKTPLAPEE